MNVRMLSRVPLSVVLCPPLLRSSFFSRGSCCLEGPRWLSDESERDEVMGDASHPASVLLIAVGGVVPWSNRAWTLRVTGEAGGGGQGAEAGVGGAGPVLGQVRRAQWVKSYFKAGIAACLLSLSGRQVVTT